MDSYCARKTTNCFKLSSKAIKSQFVLGSSEDILVSTNYAHNIQIVGHSPNVRQSIAFGFVDHIHVS